ncbi:GtrA family protein [Hylemonella gracilis]|uniref:GtrA family protein n=1 Tax=Hylemonella gracilis TaxID=80880 RepID=A0A4P6UMD4_9BURK|nr:GtrA family protein [Hylemonella gracilis]
MRLLLRQLACFVAVGVTATAMHWCLAVWLVEAWSLPAAAANLAGWVLAFGVSFAGHYTFTFRHAHTDWKRSAWRFFLISVSGFAVNELGYVGLLHTTALPYDLLLALLLVTQAGLTFLVSRLWAFRHSASVPPSQETPS